MSKKYTLAYMNAHSAKATVLDVRTDKFLFILWDGRSYSWAMHSAFDDR
jgi:hypothetical protein